MLKLVIITFLAALGTAIATGIGGGPFLVTRRMAERLGGLAWGFSGGLMLSASVFNLVFEGGRRAGYNLVALGIGLGAGLFWLTSERLGHTHFNFYHLEGAVARRVILLIGSMFVHSFAAGIA